MKATASKWHCVHRGQLDHLLHAALLRIITIILIHLSFDLE